MGRLRMAEAQPTNSADKKDLLLKTGEIKWCWRCGARAERHRAESVAEDRMQWRSSGWFGATSESEKEVDVRRALVNAIRFWCPIMLQLHRFMIATSRVSVNHDGGRELLPTPLIHWYGIRGVAGLAT